MHSATTLLMLTATLALAAPVAQPVANLGKRSFRVHHKGRPKLSPRDAVDRAFAKYGWESFEWHNHPFRPLDSPLTDTGVQQNHSTSTNSSSSSSGGSSFEEGEVTATPVENDSAYIAPVNIGGQMLNLDFDTGSSDLWVFSTELPAGSAEGHTLFNPSESSTFVQYPGATWATQYGDGSTASGNVGFDTVSIGGATVQKQCVELAEKTSGFSQLTASNGLLGLGFSSINQVKPVQQKTFWENILDQLEQPVFTADLDETATGSYEFGSIDTTKYEGEIHYAPVDSSMGYWMIDSNTYTVGGREHQCELCNPGVVDTGTSLLLLDADTVQNYYNHVQGAAIDQQSGLISYPCSSRLPNLGLAIGDGYIATLEGSKLTYVEENGRCIGGVQVGPTSEGSIQIFGDVLFKQFFAVFDGGNTQVGFAPKAAAT